MFAGLPKEPMHFSSFCLPVCGYSAIQDLFPAGAVFFTKGKSGLRLVSMFFNCCSKRHLFVLLGNVVYNNYVIFVR